jgi:hypothetical protein
VVKSFFFLGGGGGGGIPLGEKLTPPGLTV